MHVSATFKGQQAPCGDIVDGRHYQDQDEDVVITHEVASAAAAE